MRILFLCSSIEPGKDGVGDYTLALCAELAKSRHSLAIIALYDRFISQRTENEDATGIQVLRVPRNGGLRNSVKASVEFYRSFNPDLVSLQYVPYGYSRRGLPYLLATSLKKYYRQSNWHLMVHEPFIDDIKGIKNALIKRSQIAILKGLFGKLDPIAVHTTIPAYQKRLQKVGLKADILPLFGNIPILENQKEKFEQKTGIYFGSAPHQKDFEVFADSFETAIQTVGPFDLIFCGRNGERASAFVEMLKVRFKDQLKIEVLGALDGSELSVLFQLAHFGIARTAPAYLGKSGSAMAMLEHGLPIWVALAKDQDEIAAQGLGKSHVFADINACFSANGKPHAFLPEVARAFMESITKTGNR